MTLTTIDRSNLSRFGCTLLLERNTIAIPWSWKSEDLAAAANIAIRLIYTKWPSGPLLCLAIEISYSRALAQYGFVPLNMKNEDHNRYLLTLLRNSQIDFLFIAETEEISRRYELPSHQRASIADLYANAIADFNAFPVNSYDFNQCVTEFEQHSRLVDYFQYVMTERALQKAIDVTAELATKADREDVILAERIVNHASELFVSRSDLFDRQMLSRIPTARRSLLFILDLQKRFNGDSEGLHRFLVDLIAANTPRRDYQQLETAILFVKSLIRLLDDIRADTWKEDAARFNRDLQDVLTRLVQGQKVSITALIGLMTRVGLPIGGQPGRHPKDYSREYAWKASGFSWTEVTRKSLMENPEIHVEFGGRSFELLDFRQQESLKHRIEVGVKSYAERTGKAFPIDRLSTTQKPQEIG